MYDRDVLLSKKMADKLSEIGQMYFDLNRVLDAASNYLEIEVGMLKLGEYVHHSMAHYATDPLADNFRDYLTANSRRTNYNVETKGNAGKYGSPLEMFEYVIEFYSDIKNAIIEGIRMAVAEDDLDTEGFLREQLSLLRKYKDQFVLLYDKCNLAIKEGNTWQDIDSRWQDFAVFEVLGA